MIKKIFLVTIFLLSQNSLFAYSTPKDKPLVIGIFGQSFAQSLGRDPSISTLEEELRNAGYNPIFVKYGAGGSSSFKIGDNDNYWWDLEKDKPGPRLLSALEVINSTTTKPTKILWLQGEAHSFQPFDAAKYYKATASTIWALKNASNPDNPNEVETFMHVIGRRLRNPQSNSLPSIQKVREEQLRIIDATSAKFLADTWELQLIGEVNKTTDPLNSHMSPRGDKDFGWRVAQNLLQEWGDKSYYSPTVSKVDKTSNNTFEITFKVSPGTTLVRPKIPNHLAVRNGSKILDHNNMTFTWIGNKLRIKISENISSTSAYVMMPYGDLRAIQRGSIIKDSKGTPISSFKKRII